MAWPPKGDFMSTDIITTTALIEFFSARYRNRKNISGRHQMIEALAFEALAQLEWENIETQIQGKEPSFDFSKEGGSGFSANEPIPFHVLALYISVLITTFLKNRTDACGKYQSIGDGILFRPSPEFKKQMEDETQKQKKKG